MPDTNSTPVRAALYLRMSSARQEDSPARQRSQAMPYGERKGYAWVGDPTAEDYPYVDLGIAGDEFERRHGLQRLLRDARAGKFDVVVADEWSRLSRQEVTEFIATVLHPLKVAGVRVDTAAEGLIDLSDVLGIIKVAIQQDKASGESKTLSRRILSEMARKVSENRRVMGGPPPYGMKAELFWVERKGRAYQKTKRWIKGDPDKVRVVQWLFETYAGSDVSLDWLRDELFSRGVPSPKGHSHWTKAVIRWVLTNRAYVGDHLWNGATFGKHSRLTGGTVCPADRKPTANGAKRPRRLNDPDSWIVLTDLHEALVDRDLFARVQAKLAANRGRSTPLSRRGTYLLSRLLVCGRCGSWMVAGGKVARRFYRCGGYHAHGSTFCTSNHVDEGPLVAGIVRKLQETFLNPQNLQALRDEIRRQEEAERDPGALAALRARLKRLDAQIGQGARNLAVLPADVTADVLAHVRSLKEEREKAAAELERLSQPGKLDGLEDAVKAAEAMLWRLRESIHQGPPEQVREVLRSLVSKVELHFDTDPKEKLTRTRLTGGVIYLHRGGPLTLTNPDDAVQRPDGARGGAPG